MVVLYFLIFSYLTVLINKVFSPGGSNPLAPIHKHFVDQDLIDVVVREGWSDGGPFPSAFSAPSRSSSRSTGQ